MQINTNCIIILDDHNEYAIVKKLFYQNKNYYYIVDINNNSNLKFCYQDNDTLVEIKNASVLKEIIPLFSNSNINN